jgi:hypothetical protein
MMFNFIYGSSKFVGFALMAYGLTLALLLESFQMEFIGLLAYYAGVFQFCSEDIEDFYDGEVHLS